MSTVEVDPKIGDPPCEVERNNSRFDAENTKSNSNDPVTASERGDGKLDTDDSELDSEKSHSDYDFERITEDEAAAAGDGLAEGGKDVIPHDSAKSKIRRRRTQQNGELEATPQEPGNRETVQQDQLILDYPKATDGQPETQKQDQACDTNPESDPTTDNTAAATPTNSLWTWFMYVVPKATCLIILSLIYLGLILLSIRILNMSSKKT